MIRTASVVFILILLTISCTMADIAIEGVTQYNIEYNLTNEGMYPDYIFLTSSGIRGWDYPNLIQNGTFGGGYKLDSFNIHAIRKDMIDNSIIEKLSMNNLKQDLDANEDKLNITDYLTNAPMITANLSLPVGEFYEDQMNIQNVSVNLIISNVSDSEFNVTRDIVIFGYKNGETVEMKVNESAELIPPSYV